MQCPTCANGVSSSGSTAPMSPARTSLGRPAGRIDRRDRPGQRLADPGDTSLRLRAVHRPHFAGWPPTAGLLVTRYALGVMIGAPIMTALGTKVSCKHMLILLMACSARQPDLCARAAFGSCWSAAWSPPALMAPSSVSTRSSGWRGTWGSPFRVTPCWKLPGGAPDCRGGQPCAAAWMARPSGWWHSAGDPPAAWGTSRPIPASGSGSAGCAPAGGRQTPHILNGDDRRSASGS